MIPYALPFRRPYVTARGTLARREIILLRIRTAGGAVGLGEGVPLALRGGTSLTGVVSELESWGARAVAGEVGLEGMCGPARIAAETALADAEARTRGLPLHRLLKADSTGLPVPCNATLTAGGAKDVLNQAEEWAGQGFTVFKLKLGVSDDVAQVRAVREGLGDAVKIRIDANESWAPDEAEDRLAALEPFEIELAEQPVAGLMAMARLRATSPIPLVADESVNSAGEAAEAAKLAACDAVTVKLSKTGTLDATLGGHLPTYLSSALDGPVGIATAAHVAQTLPADGPWSGTAHGLATERLFSATIIDRDGLLDGATLPVPAGHGLGLEIDERALKAHRL